MTLLAELHASPVSCPAMTGRDIFLMRRAAGWSQKDMARLLEISKRTYERIERDEGRELKQGEKLMALLWWRRLLETGLTLALMDDPGSTPRVATRWWIESSLPGRASFRSLGPYDTRLDALHVLRNLERFGKVG